MWVLHYYRQDGLASIAYAGIMLCVQPTEESGRCDPEQRGKYELKVANVLSAQLLEHPAHASKAAKVLVNSFAGHT